MMRFAARKFKRSGFVVIETPTPPPLVADALSKRRFSVDTYTTSRIPMIAMVRPRLQAVNVRHAIDAARQATDHGDATLGERPGKLLCHPLSIGRWVT